MKKTIYEVFALSPYASDLLECDTLEQAEKQALDWSMDKIDVDIMIVKVEKTRVKTFRNGGEVA